MSRLLSAVLLLAAAASAAAQAPTFRAGANYVRVDMYATRDGVPVGDLRMEEVTVLEDGVPQRIEAFEHVVIRPAGAQEARIDPNTVAASRQAAADPRARVFVIFLDTLHTQIEGSSNVRIPLTRFLDRVLGPDDLVALMTPEMAASDIAFARKTVVIGNIMEKEWTWGRRGSLVTRDPKEQLYESCYPDQFGSDTQGIAQAMTERRREKLTLDALDDLIAHLRGLREERKAIITVTEGWRLFREDRRLSAVIPSRGAPVADTFRGRRGMRGQGSGAAQGNGTTPSTIECEADRLALASIDHSRRVRRLAEDANRANVTFYPVYARGLAAVDEPITSRQMRSMAEDRQVLDTRQDGLRQLAEQTDGVAVVGTNDIEGALQRIAADLSSYYLLGYTSTNAKLDGRFRAIAVRVTRPGVRIRARRGYRGLTADELATARDGERRAEPASSAAVVNPRALFRVRSAAWTPGEEEGPTVWVVGELDYATRKDLAWSAGATADVTLIAGDGREVESTSVPVPSGQTGFSVRLPQTVRLEPGEYALRVRVRPESGSGLPLTDTARLTLSRGAEPLGDAVLWRRGPSTGTRYAATADPRFQRSERVRLEIPTTAGGEATARMLDRAGNPLRVPVQVSARGDESGRYRWIVADAVLAPLAAGDYSIEVSVGDAKRVTPFKVVP